MVLELPGMWWGAVMDRARGDGDLVGEMGMGEGEGVRARGERGMWPTDFRLDGECMVLALTCNLCFNPCVSP